MQPNRKTIGLVLLIPALLLLGHSIGATRQGMAASSGLPDPSQLLQMLTGGAGSIVAALMAFLGKGGASPILGVLKPWQRALVEAATEYAQGQALDSIDLVANYSDGNKSSLHIDVPNTPLGPNTPTVNPNWKKLVDELEKRFHPKPPTPTPPAPVVTP